MTAEASARLAQDPSQSVLGTLDKTLGCTDMRSPMMAICTFEFSWTSGPVLPPVQVRIMRAGDTRFFDTTAQVQTGSATTS